MTSMEEQRTRTRWITFGLVAAAATVGVVAASARPGSSVSTDGIAQDTIVESNHPSGYERVRLHVEGMA